MSRRNYALVAAGLKCARELEAEGIATPQVVNMVSTLAMELQSAEDRAHEAEVSAERERAYVRKLERTAKKAQQLDTGSS